MSEVIGYAIVDSATQLVVNVINWDGSDDWAPDEGFTAVPLVGGAGIGYTYNNGVFTAPPVAPPSAADILAANTGTRNQLLAAAALAIAPLQDAEDLGEATAEESSLLKSWKQFRVAVNRMNLTVLNPTWPTPPQSGYGAALAPVTSSS